MKGEKEGPGHHLFLLPPHAWLLLRRLEPGGRQRCSARPSVSAWVVPCLPTACLVVWPEATHPGKLLLVRLRLTAGHCWSLTLGCNTKGTETGPTEEKALSPTLSSPGVTWWQASRLCSSISSPISSCYSQEARIHLPGSCCGIEHALSAGPVTVSWSPGPSHPA